MLVGCIAIGVAVHDVSDMLAVGLVLAGISLALTSYFVTASGMVLSDREHKRPSVKRLRYLVGATCLVAAVGGVVALAGGHRPTPALLVVLDIVAALTAAEALYRLMA